VRSNSKFWRASSSLRWVAKAQSTSYSSLLLSCMNNVWKMASGQGTVKLLIGCSDWIVCQLVIAMALHLSLS